MYLFRNKAWYENYKAVKPGFVPLLQHVVHENKIEKKPKISEYFIVTFVEQPSYDYLDICEDKWLNKISASITKHRIILPRIKW